MPNETIVVYGTPLTLEASGASISNNNVAQAVAATYNVSTNGGGYPDALFVLSCTFGTAPTENTAVVLLARPINIDSTNDSEAPENGATTFKGVIIGSFTLNNVTTAQYISLVAYDLPAEAEYYIWNNATGQTLSAGWTLKITPRTYGPV